MRRQILVLIVFLTLGVATATATARAQDFAAFDGVAEESAADARQLAVIAQLRIALGDTSVDQARADFAEDFKKIGDLPEGDLKARLSDLANRYADRVEGAITGSVQWPDDREPEEYLRLAIVKLAILREEALKAIDAGASPLAALEAMNLVLTWAGGNSEIAENSEFSGVDDAVASSGAIYEKIEKPARDSGDGGNAIPYEEATERKGGDYTAFELEAADPSLCDFECLKDEQCKAWTYVNPGRDAAGAACWLKSSVPQPISDPCCTSGVKTQ
ncbi:hypothetical protein BH10PSE7_BH10PSE7_37640 [soil metagenome]